MEIYRFIFKKKNFIIFLHHIGMTMERAKMEISPPRDRLNLILFVLVLHGIGTLTPWNMFITAKAVRI